MEKLESPEAKMENDCGFTLPLPLSSVLRLEHIKLDHLSESVFQASDLQNVKEIVLSHSEIEVLPDNFTSNLKNLKSLNLEGNRLTQFPVQLNKCQSLEWLNASNNNLKLMSDEIGNLLNLQYLDISYNIITEIPRNILVSLINLKYLKISDNDISEIPDEIGALVNLEILDVSNNSIFSLPDSLNNLRKLTYLDASTNRLSNLPSCLDFLKLATLILSSNKFTNIPDCLTFNLSSINVLDLSCNEIMFFDVAPKSIARLVKLDLSYNMLSDIPSWLFGERCRSLKQLNISFNKNMMGISAVSVYAKSGDTSGVSSNLRFLIANNCCFSSSSVKFLYGLKALESLDLSNKITRGWKRKFGNILLSLPTSMLITCTNLKHLNVSSVAMSDLPDDIGSLSARLETLDLSYNTLLILPDSFCKLVSLMKLDLSNNQLETLPSDFGALATLEELRLNSNKFQALPDSLKKLKKLRILDLYDNSFFNFPLVVLLIQSLEALDIEQNFIRVCDLDEGNEDFIFKYTALKTFMRLHLTCNDQQTERKDGRKLEVKDEVNNDEIAPEDISSVESETELEPEGNFEIKKKEDVEKEEENWDLEEENDSNFDPHLVKKRQPKQASYSPSLLVYEPVIPTSDHFCPAEYHSKPVMRARKHFEAPRYEVPGQFDDADD